ncbi:MAG: hypothetical protein EBE86_013940 [Hormoscilla sp. GUM202]|nr:hypothetical protein [Hormoscilla sp. GUM202]
MIVLLDSGPLGILTNPKASPLTLECRRWVESLLLKKYKVILPEIADYEVLTPIEKRDTLICARLGIRREQLWLMMQTIAPVGADSRSCHVK